MGGESLLTAGADGTVIVGDEAWLVPGDAECVESKEENFRRWGGSWRLNWAGEGCPMAMALAAINSGWTLTDSWTVVNDGAKCENGE
jgi:hypothetical protein